MSVTGLPQKVGKSGEILIIGAAPAGSVAAALLRQQDRQFLMLERRLQLVGEDRTLSKLLENACWDTPLRRIVGYAANVKSLSGRGYALLGNAAEFLDPIFSSGSRSLSNRRVLPPESCSVASPEKRSLGLVNMLCRLKSASILSEPLSILGIEEIFSGSFFIGINRRKFAV